LTDRSPQIRLRRIARLLAQATIRTMTVVVTALLAVLMLAASIIFVPGRAGAPVLDILGETTQAMAAPESSFSRVDAFNNTTRDDTDDTVSPASVGPCGFFLATARLVEAVPLHEHGQLTFVGARYVVGRGPPSPCGQHQGSRRSPWSAATAASRSSSASAGAIPARVSTTAWVTSQVDSVTRLHIPPRGADVALLEHRRRHGRQKERGDDMTDHTNQRHGVDPPDSPRPDPAPDASLQDRTILRCIEALGELEVALQASEEAHSSGGDSVIDPSDGDGSRPGNHEVGDGLPERNPMDNIAIETPKPEVRAWEPPDNPYDEEGPFEDCESKVMLSAVDWFAEEDRREALFELGEECEQECDPAILITEWFDLLEDFHGVGRAVAVTNFMLFLDTIHAHHGHRVLRHFTDSYAWSAAKLAGGVAHPNLVEVMGGVFLRWVTTEKPSLREINHLLNGAIHYVWFKTRDDDEGDEENPGVTVEVLLPLASSYPAIGPAEFETLREVMNADPHMPFEVVPLDEQVKPRREPFEGGWSCYKRDCNVNGPVFDPHRVLAAAERVERKAAEESSQNA